MSKAAKPDRDANGENRRQLGNSNPTSAGGAQGPEQTVGLAKGESLLVNGRWVVCTRFYFQCGILSEDGVIPYHLVAWERRPPTQKDETT